MLLLICAGMLLVEVWGVNSIYDRPPKREMLCKRRVCEKRGVCSAARAGIGKMSCCSCCCSSCSPAAWGSSQFFPFGRNFVSGEIWSAAAFLLYCRGGAQERRGRSTQERRLVDLLLYWRGGAEERRGARRSGVWLVSYYIVEEQHRSAAEGACRSGVWLVSY